MKVRIKDRVVHVRAGNKILLVSDPYNPDHFPDIESIIKQEKEQHDKSLIFTIPTETLKALAKNGSDFLTLKVHEKLNIGRWKDNKGNSGYFAQAIIED